MIPFSTIRDRYFLLQFCGMFFLFLACFYGFYILVDYASRSGSIGNHSSQADWIDVLGYYSSVFVSRAEILIPLALLIAAVHTLSTLNTRSELVAFMAAGISLRQLMRPLVAVALFFVLLLYLNEEWILPHALKKLRRAEDAAKVKRRRQITNMAARTLTLDDGSLLIYQSFDTHQERFFDVFWVRSFDLILRMKSLSPSLPVPMGYFVDRLVRQKNGEVLQEEQYEELALPDLKFNEDKLQSTLQDPDLLSLTELYQKSGQIGFPLTEKEAKLLTAFYWKLMLPWLCFAALIIPAPFCTRFSRSPPLFLIYAFSLFGLIAFYMLIDAAQVTAKRQVLSPALAIFTPFAAAAVFSAMAFRRLGR